MLLVSLTILFFLIRKPGILVIVLGILIRKLIVVVPFSSLGVECVALIGREWYVLGNTSWQVGLM